MAQHLEVTAETVVTVKMSEEYAGKMIGSVGRVLAAVDHMTDGQRTQLVNTGTIDNLVALRNGMMLALEKS